MTDIIPINISSLFTFGSRSEQAIQKRSAGYVYILTIRPGKFVRESVIPADTSYTSTSCLAS